MVGNLLERISSLDIKGRCCRRRWDWTDLEAFSGGGSGRCVSDVWAQHVSVHAICTASPASGESPRIYFQELLRQLEEQEEQTVLRNRFQTETTQGPVAVVRFHRGGGSRSQISSSKRRIKVALRQMLLSDLQLDFQ